MKDEWREIRAREPFYREARRFRKLHEMLSAGKSPNFFTAYIASRMERVCELLADEAAREWMN